MATAERATQLFQTALMYTVSNEAVSAIIEGADSQLLPMVTLAALGAVAAAYNMFEYLQRVSKKGGYGQEQQQALALALHLLSLTLDVMVQFASNAIGRLVLWAFIGSASPSATIMGVIVGIILLWALRKATSALV